MPVPIVVSEKTYMALCQVKMEYYKKTAKKTTFDKIIGGMLKNGRN